MGGSYFDFKLESDPWKWENCGGPGPERLSNSPQQVPFWRPWARPKESSVIDEHSQTVAKAVRTDFIQ